MVSWQRTSCNGATLLQAFEASKMRSAHILLKHGLPMSVVKPAAKKGITRAFTPHLYEKRSSLCYTGWLARLYVWKSGAALKR